MDARFWGDTKLPIAYHYSFPKEQEAMDWQEKKLAGLARKSGWTAGPHDLLRLKKLLSLARESGWEGWRVSRQGVLYLKNEGIQGLNEAQKRLVGGQPPGVTFGGRMPLFPEGTIWVAESWTRYERGFGYMGHCCNLYVIPGGDGRFHLGAWCFNWNFSCPLGRRTRAALEAGNVDSLPVFVW